MLATNRPDVDVMLPSARLERIGTRKLLPPLEVSVDLQGRILLSYGIMAAGVIAIFAYVALSSASSTLEQSVVQSIWYRIRTGWFWLLLSVLVIAFFVTTPFFPYASGRALGQAKHITVVARQYAFQDLPHTIPYDTPIVFDVTSADVNHGFGIFDPRGQLIAQVQAMPGYVNHLRVTFTERGKYMVRCMEYCGIDHYLMRASFEVR